MISPSLTSHKWKADKDDEGAGKGSPKKRSKWLDDHPALHDGARLQALEAKHMDNILLRRDTKDVPPILHQEKLDDAKNRVQQATGLRPTNEKLLNSIKSLKVPPRLRDHIRNMLLGRIKCRDIILEQYPRL